MNDSRDTADGSEGAAGKPPEGGGKPSYQQLRDALRKAITGSPSDKQRRSALVRILRRDFKRDKKKNEVIRDTQVDEIANDLKAFENDTDLVLALFVAAPKTGRPFIACIRDRLSHSYASKLGYPTSRSLNDDRLFDLRQWIRAGDQTRGDGEPRFPARWVRGAVICLANEPDPAIRLHSLNELLDAIELERTPRPRVDDDIAFPYVKLIVSQILSGRLDGLLRSRPLRLPDMLRQKELKELARINDAARASAQQKQLESESQRDELSARATFLAGRVADLESSLADALKAAEHERQAAHDREHHLTHEWQQQTAQKRFSLKRRMLHELEEAILCLDRKEPNTEMALSRIRRAEQIIREME